MNDETNNEPDIKINDLNDEIKNPNALIVITYLLLIIALAVSVFFNLTTVPAENNQEVAKVKCENFSDLPENTQNSYVLKGDLEAIQESFSKLQTQNNTLNHQLTLAKGNVVEENIKEEKVVSTEATKVKDFAKCYNMDNSDYIISYQCKKEITNYVDKHKDAKYFEIIAIVDPLEFKLYKNLQNNEFLYEKLDVNQTTIDKLKKFSQAGLAKQRAVEASWVIKAHAGRKTKTYTVHYEIVSQEGKKGVLVRAYK